MPSDTVRIATVLFADVIGFTGLSEQLDPEAVREVMEACFRPLEGEIARLGGVVDKYIGDCVMAVFGAPTSHGNDAERACLAGLAMQREVAAFQHPSLRNLGIHLQMRIGINTGRLVAGGFGGERTRSYTVLGDTVNVASRLEHAAPVGGVLVSHSTYQHVAGLFDVTPRPPMEIRGRREPMRVFELGPRRAHGYHRAPRSVAGLDTRCVGREPELARLAELVQEVLEDSVARVVTIVGAPGVGKSRLRYELEEHIESLAPVGFLDFKTRSSPLSRAEPLHALLELLRSRLGLYEELGADPREVLRARVTELRGVMATLRARGAGSRRSAAPPDAGARRQTSTEGRLAELLGFERTTSEVQEMFGPGERGGVHLGRIAKTFGDLVGTLLEQVPVAVWLEDIHWADDASLDVLEQVLAAQADRPLLVVATARPELLTRRPRWGADLDTHLRVELRPLSRRHAEQVARELLRRVDDPPEHLIAQMVGRSDGNPYFMEEVLRLMLDQGILEPSTAADQPWQLRRDRVSEFAVPETVQGIIQARFDAFSTAERALLERAAVVGRTFWAGALETMGSPAPLGPVLERLITHGVIRRHPTTSVPGQDEYRFAHALLPEVISDTLTERMRATHHAAIAVWLEQQPGLVDASPALVARHLELGGQIRAAVARYLVSGQRALERGCNTDAAELFERALRLLEPRTVPGRERRVATAHERVDVCMGLAETRRRTGDLEGAARALERGASMLPAGERRRDEADASQLAHLAASVELRRGQLARLGGHAGEAIIAFEAALRHLGDHASVLRAVLLTELAMSYTLDGRPQHTLTLARSALRALAAAAADDPRGLAYARFRVQSAIAHVGFRLGRGGWTRFWCERALAAAERTGDLGTIGTAANNLASSHYLSGELAQARTWYQRSLEIREQLGDLADCAISLSNLAELALRSDELAEATRLSERAVAIAERIRATAILPDALRNQAEIALAQGRTAAAGTAAERALEIARETGQTVFEGAIARIILRVRLRDVRAPGRGTQERLADWDRIDELLGLAVRDAARAEAARLLEEVQGLAEGDPDRDSETVGILRARVEASLDELRGQADDAT